MGGTIGFLAAWFSATWTARQNRLAREREANQAVLHVLTRMRKALDTESRYNDEDLRNRDAEGYATARALVDELSEELVIIAGNTASADRHDLRICAEAIRTRAEMGEDPVSFGTKAVAVMRALTSARLYHEAVPDWTKGALRRFQSHFEAVEESWAWVDREQETEHRRGQA